MYAEPKLRVQVRNKLRARHYSYRTEQQYLVWIRRFIVHFGKRHPRDVMLPQVEAFLTHLAVDRKVSASTQNEALSVILFDYRHVLGIELPWLEHVVRAKKPTRLPTVLSPLGVERLLVHLEGVYALIARLLYGSGLRLMEALRLRVKDIDFEYGQDYRARRRNPTLSSYRGHCKTCRPAYAAQLLRHVSPGARL